MTIIEKIIAAHVYPVRNRRFSNGVGEKQVKSGDIIEMEIDVRIARDFGGANVIKNIKEKGLEINDPEKTFFTFDCNPCGSDQAYAKNQQICRQFARERGIKVFDINQGVGTHLAIDNGLINSGETLVSTDSHANIVGAIGAFGQGMGDQEIAYVFAYGKVWFEVPPTVKVIIKGNLPKSCTAKDLTLAIIRHFGAKGLQGRAAEFCGPAIENLFLDERITLSSMVSEMAGIIGLISLSPERFYTRFMMADRNAQYEDIHEIDISNLRPLTSLPGHPDNIVPVEKVQGTKIDSAFIGSCTNGRYSDLEKAARILWNRKVAPGVVLKIVPSTNEIWKSCLEDGIIGVFKEAGALIGNAGCAGCAQGQIGQNGPGEVVVSTGNRNFLGKQGLGEVYLASPETAAASAIAGYITTKDEIPSKPLLFDLGTRTKKLQTSKYKIYELYGKPIKITSKVFVISKDNIDTDMIFPNRFLTVIDTREMAKHAFGNLKGFKDFSQKVNSLDILVIVGENFGAGSSRQQAVDCFRALGISAIIAKSFAPIYKRNAINAGLPILECKDLEKLNLKNHEKIFVDFTSGKIENSKGKTIKAKPFSKIQMEIYQRGGLLE